MKGSVKTLSLALALVLLLTACGGSKSAAPAPAPAPAAPAASSAAPAPAPAPSKWVPEREIRLIVPYKEGGASHKAGLLIKAAAEKLNAIEKPFIVVCMPDAATLAGQEEVLNAKPDGYTLLIHHNAMVNGYALGKQDFTYTDFRMINQLYETPLAIAVRADSPFQSLDDIVKASKAEPGKYSWTWVGTGGNTQFAAYVFYNAAGMDADKEVVPCITKSDGDSVVNLLGGTADICIAQTNAFPEFVKSGEVRVLGHSGTGTIDIGGQPVKSWVDLGYKDALYSLRCFMFAPKDIPEEIFNRYTEVFEVLVNSPEFGEAMIKDGFTPEFLGEKESIEKFKIEADNAIETAKNIEKK